MEEDDSAEGISFGLQHVKSVPVLLEMAGIDGPSSK
jgi:hypothetical protein